MRAGACGDDAQTLAELDRAALLVRRAGLVHLVTDVTEVEAEALARAGVTVAREDAILLVDALLDPPAALEPFDGGASKRQQTLAWARRAPVEVAHGTQ